MTVVDKGKKIEKFNIHFKVILLFNTFANCNK